MHLLKIAVLTTCLTGITLGLLPAPAQSQLRSNEKGCKPIGRIVQASQDQGKQICREQHPQFNLLRSGDFLCYLNQRVFRQIQLAQFLDKCQAPQRETWKSCHFIEQGLCRRTRNIADLYLLTPFSDLVLDPRPTLNWTSAPNASQYRVSFESITHKAWAWTTYVKSNHLEYPVHKPPLQAGHQYRVTVTALGADGEPSAGLVASLRLISQSQQALLDADLKTLEGLNIPKAHQYQDLNTIYMQHGLLSLAIQTLEEIAEAYPDNPDLYRLLGDHYWGVGQAVRARDYYRLARRVAAETQNLSILKQVEERLWLVGRLQPTAQ